MATYTKTTNFTAKDNLTSGDPAKVIKGSEFDTEFNAIETAVNSKANANNGTHTGTTTIATANIDTLQIDGVAVTATAAELNTLDGITASTAELNITDGLTATTAELNTLDGITSTTTELNKLDGFTGTVDDLNYAKDLRATGVTTAEFDKLDGLTATTTELNYTDGVTSNIQTQLDGKASSTASPTITLSGDLSGSATLTNLGNTTLTATVADDSHNHVISNVDGLQTALDSKANLSGANFTGNVDVTGTVTADGLTVDNSGDAITLTNGDGLTQLGKLKGDTTDGFVIEGKVNNNLTLRTKANTAGEGIKFQNTSGNNMMFIDGTTGDIQFYEDTGTTAKFVWDSSAERLGVGTSNPQDKLHVADGKVKVTGSGDLASYGYIKGTETTFNAHTLTLGTTYGYSTDVDALSIYNGNVGIGTSSPSGKLHSVVSSVGDASLKLSRTGSSAFEFQQGISGVTGDALSIKDVSLSHDYLTLRSGNVGIGTSSPAQKLDIVGSGDTYFKIGDGTFNSYFGSESNGTYLGNDTNKPIRFLTATTERARIDSSGNAIFGKTTANNTTVGTTIYNDNGVSIVRDANPTMIHNRLNSDGDIEVFRKDGSTVGSIGSVAGVSTYIHGGTGYSGVTFGNDEILPCNESGATRDNAIDLGDSSGRFKDLYLSGGVYLGGTGSANKLDDYETGTFSPNALATFTVNNCSYTKIGRMVMLNIDVTCPASSSGTVIQLGVPFTPSGSTYNGSGTISYTDNRTDIQSFEVVNSTGRLQIRRGDDGHASFAGCSGNRVIGSVVYETNA